jgi:hypothetical protein
LEEPRDDDPLWIETAPETRIEEDVVHVRGESGGELVHVAMHPHTRFAAASSAIAEYRRWQAEKRQSSSGGEGGPAPHD